MKVFDFHSHPKNNTTQKYGYDMTDELFVEELKRADITMAAGSAIDLPLLEGCQDYGKAVQTLNEMIFSFYEKYSDFFVPGIHIHPDFPELSAAEIEKYYNKGVKLVGELCPYLMGCDTYLSKGFFELFKLCEEKEMLVSVHPGDPDEFAKIAKEFKNLKIVMAHPSYGNDYENRLEIVKNHDNVYLDLSGTGIAAYGMLRYGVDKVSKEKILFGTDFPGYNPEMYVRSVLYSKLTDEELEHILWKNAVTLLDIK